jgi:hypothetical protein
MTGPGCSGALRDEMGVRVPRNANSLGGDAGVINSSVFGNVKVRERG